MTFLYNLLLFSPLLILAAGALYLLDRLDSSRRNSPEPSPPPDQLETETDLHPEVRAEAADEDVDETDSAASEPEPHPNQQEQHLEPGGPSAPRIPRTRTIGPKKARSIAQRDRRRAYHEFLHSQAQQRAEAEAALREEDEARAFENARRRALVEEEIEARRERERVRRLEEEKMERRRESNDVEALKGMVQGGKAVELGRLGRKLSRERGWVEGVLRREGLLGVGDDRSVAMVTRSGWWVRVGKDDMEQLWAVVEEKGTMKWADMAEILEGLLVK
jgi:hypothetical protein